MAQPRVLVADDDDKIRELLELYLTKEGFAVEQAADGAEAILKAQQLGKDEEVLGKLKDELRAVDTQIKRIRQKIPDDGLTWGIRTVYGVGYKFGASDAPV